MAIYFLGFALCLVPLTIAVAALQAAFRVLRRVATIGEAKFAVSTAQARPGEKIAVWGRVRARWSRPITVQVRLSCTMFDHRSHELFSSSRTMHPVPDKTNEYSATLVLPGYALRTGLVGRKLPNPYAGRTRRMIIVWAVDFEARSAGGTVLYRRSCGVDVPAGRRLKTNFRRMSLLAMDTFSTTRNDLLFNWLVHLAACDGAITSPERQLLHDLFGEMGGMAGDEDADARIDRELQRQLVIDDIFLQRYVPLEERLELYRGLLTLAWSDGVLHEQEREFLAKARQSLGLDSGDVKMMEGEVADARPSASTP